MTDKAGQFAFKPAPAAGPDLVRELTAWIAGHTDYNTARATRDPPSIAFCEAGEIIRYEGKDLIVDAQLQAAYDLRRRRIFLVLPWHASDARDVSTLLHEPLQLQQLEPHLLGLVHIVVLDHDKVRHARSSRVPSRKNCL